jgi:ubiquinone biosynthesis protein UbiJ
MPTKVKIGGGKRGPQIQQAQKQIQKKQSAFAQAISNRVSQQQGAFQAAEYAQRLASMRQQIQRLKQQVQNLKLAQQMQNPAKKLRA